jgi:hypothetical protein
VYYICVKFHKNPISGLGGVAFTRYMDGRTNRVIPIYPPIFVCGGIITLCSRLGREIPVSGIPSGNYREIPSWEILQVLAQVGNMIFRCD